MSYIAQHLNSLNDQKKKALSVFLTAGFPSKNNFVDLAVDLLDAGADMLELGVPFSDPLADGPVIQMSSQASLDNGVGLKDVLSYANKIKGKVKKPVILMGYANPLLRFGLKDFLNQAVNSGVDGLIVPDIPLEEYESFWGNNSSKIDNILLTTPMASPERIQSIDKLSSGFVYYVSVKGTTGERRQFDPKIINSLKRTYSLIKNNKMLVGFGISTPETIKSFQSHCDGFIVGSAVINSLLEDTDGGFKKTIEYVNTLSQACHSSE